jgi:hypothetical protein
MIDVSSGLGREGDMRVAPGVKLAGEDWFPRVPSELGVEVEMNARLAVDSVLVVDSGVTIVQCAILNAKHAKTRIIVILLNFPSNIGQHAFLSDLLIPEPPKRTNPSKN